MSLSIENGRYYQKMSETFKYKDYLLEVFKDREKEFDAAAKDLLEDDKIRVDKADKIIDVMTHLINEYKGIPCGKSDNYQQWYEVLITSAYLYALYFNERQPIVSLVYPRQYTQKLGISAGVPTGDLEYIYQSVEAAQGFYGPQKWKSPADTPGEMMTLAVYFLNHKDTMEDPMD